MSVIISRPIRYLTIRSFRKFVAAFFMVSLSLFLPLSAAAQTLDADSASTMEIHEITFVGNVTFDAAALKEAITLKETPSGFSKFLFYTLGDKLGSKPEYFNIDKFNSDIDDLKRFYQDHGFYEAAIKGNYAPAPGNEEVDLSFTIEESERSIVDTVRYLGLSDVPPEVITEIYRDPILQKGMPYESPNGGMEVARIINILVNSGYPAATFDVDHSGAFHRQSAHAFNLTYVFKTGIARRFGDITIHVDPPREDIVDHLTLRQLDFEPGDIYNRKKKISSESNLNRIGLFETARIDHPVPSESSGTAAIPIDIFVRPRAKNEFSPEIIASDENNAFNLGIGLAYTNRNFFGDGRTFTPRVRARTQTIRELFKGNIAKDTAFIGALTIDFEILQPYLFTRTLSGSWTSTVEFDKERDYVLSILRNKIGVSRRFATFTTGFVDWTLERVSTEVFNPAANLDSIINALTEKPQFNSIITFTLQRDKTNDVFSPTAGFFHSISLEESGILPKMFPGIAGDLPYTQYYKALLLGRWYEDISTTGFNIFAFKLKSGYQEKYGESKNSSVFIPLNRRFFSGGSGSVRGWRARELGAMSDDLLPYGGNVIIEGNAELRVNHFRGFGKVGFIKMENIWGVYFLDFGTVWNKGSDFRFDDIAVAAGIGFRYNTFFGPFRLDFGFRVYDPKEAPGRKTIFDKKFFSETMSSGIIHFGIGQAF